MEDPYATDTELFMVTFSHAHGIDTDAFGVHDTVRDIDSIESNLRRCGYVDPVVIEWTDRTGTHRPGNVVRSSTVIFASTEDPFTDVGGYFACGCHGSQREHTCMPND